MMGPNGSWARPRTRLRRLVTGSVNHDVGYSRRRNSQRQWRKKVSADFGEIGLHHGKVVLDGQIEILGAKL